MAFISDRKIENSDISNCETKIKLEANNVDLECNICGKTFDSRNKLEYHEKAHIGTNHFQCKICSKEFVRKHNLYVHQAQRDRRGE